MATTSDANTSSATLSEVTERLEGEGFNGQFGVADAGEVRCHSCHTNFAVEGIEVKDIERTEGVSDPDDMAAVAAVVCPNCQTQGTLILKYGPASDPDDAEVLRLL